MLTQKIIHKGFKIKILSGTLLCLDLRRIKYNFDIGKMYMNVKDKGRIYKKIV